MNHVLNLCGQRQSKRSHNDPKEQDEEAESDD
jgi:hypothetical protein